MRVPALLLPAILAFGFVEACKSTGARSPLPLSPSASTMSGVWNAKDGLFLDTPKAEMMAPLPEADAFSPEIQETPGDAVQFGLTDDAPTNSQGIESLTINCAKADKEITSDKWSAYVALQLDGVTVKGMTQPLKACGQIQLNVKNLNATLRYVVQVSYFANVSGKQLVFYKGQTPKFNPSDTNVALTLIKVLQNQTVDVIQSVGPKALCEKGHYFWNGFGCLSNFGTMSFAYTDMTDQNPSTKDNQKKMCLSINPNNSLPELQPCGAVEAVQRLRPELSQTTKVGGMTAPWYQIKFDAPNDGDTPQCLTVVFPGSQGVFGTAEIQSRRCKQTANGLPDTKQLFTMVPNTNTSADGYFNSFKVMSPAFPEEPNVHRCIAVKIRSGVHISGAVASGPGTIIYPEKCNTTEEAVRQSQYVKFDLTP